MHADIKPQFGVLSDAEARDLLQRNHLGRLAFAHRARVDIEPISYVKDGDWLYFRTSPGTKLTTVRRHPWVAFEVDEVHGMHHWDSVVVRGTVYHLIDADNTVDSDAYAHALAVLRQFDPDALTPRDSAPHRTELLRIHLNEVSSRSARPANIAKDA